jgi:hypothetical protein
VAYAADGTTLARTAAFSAGKPFALRLQDGTVDAHADKVTPARRP